MKPEQRKFSNRPLFPTQADRALFVDREDEIRHALESIRRGYNVLLVGARGTGKTSLLYRIYDIAIEEGLLPIPCRTQEVPRDQADFLRMLLRALLLEIDALGQRAGRVAESARDIGGTFRASGRPIGVGDSLYQAFGNMEPTGDSYACRTLENLLDDLAKDGKPAVFLIDNFSEVPDLFRRAFGGLRDYLWSLGIRFVVTADLSVKETLMAPPVGSFFETTIVLSNFTQEDSVKALALRGLEDRGLVHDIHEATRGNPLLSMMVARRVVLGELDADELRSKVAERAGLLQSLSSPEREVMLYIDQKGPASASDKRFQSKMRVGRSRLVQILQDLETAGIVIPKREGRRVYYRLIPQWQLYRGVDNESGTDI